MTVEVSARTENHSCTAVFSLGSEYECFDEPLSFGRVFALGEDLFELVDDQDQIAAFRPPGEGPVNMRTQILRVGPQIIPDRGHGFTGQSRQLDRAGLERAASGTAVSAKIKPGVAVRTTVRDAKNGQPVANTCVQPVDVSAPGISAWANTSRGWCSDKNGAVTVGPLPVAAYRLFARPGDGAHGMQWVGENGGTGMQEHARQVVPASGTVSVVPDIKLDGAGTVAGTVHDETTGQPIQQVYVFPYASDFGTGSTYTDRTGQYKLTGLGPYAWPLEFVGLTDAYGWRWSGNAEHRLAATPVTVVEGGDVAMDALLQPTGKITGSATGNDMVSIVAFNAISGDWAGPRVTDSQFTLAGLGTQQVKVKFTEHGSQKEVWFRDAASARDAQVVQVRSGETTPGIDQVIR